MLLYSWRRLCSRKCGSLSNYYNILFSESFSSSSSSSSWSLTYQASCRNSWHHICSCLRFIEQIIVVIKLNLVLLICELDLDSLREWFRMRGSCFNGNILFSVILSKNKFPSTGGDFIMFFCLGAHCPFFSQSELHSSVLSRIYVIL